MAAIKGGDKLAIALAKIAAGVKNPATLSVGFLAGAMSTDGQSIPERAALNEFGHQAPDGSIVPPRPFFRSTVASKSPGWPKAVGDLLKRRLGSREKASKVNCKRRSRSSIAYR
jgi:hypothetical protein